MTEPADILVNKVAQSGIVTIDLENYYTDGERCKIDVKDNLFMGLILKEKDFREWIKNHDWQQYKNKLVAICCTADAIVPTWAYMLIASKLNGIAQYYVFGDEQALELSLFEKTLSQLNALDFEDKRVVIKGCGDKNISPAAYVLAMQKLQPHVKSIMFGEPCSTVPVFKK